MTHCFCFATFFLFELVLAYLAPEAVMMFWSLLPSLMPAKEELMSLRTRLLLDVLRERSA
jgi:hypothetical protein